MCVTADAVAQMRPRGTLSCVVILALGRLVLSGSRDPALAGMEHLERGRFQEAASLLGRAASGQTAHPQTYRFLAKAYEGIHEWARAAEACDKLAARRLKDRALVIAHARRLRRFGDLGFETLNGVSPAQEQEFRGIAADPYRHGFVQLAACERLGRHYYSTGREDLAIRFYERLSAAPKSFRTARCLSDYAELRRRQGDRVGCVKLLEELSRRPSARVFNAHGALARVYGDWARELHGH